MFHKCKVVLLISMVLQLQPCLSMEKNESGGKPEAGWEQAQERCYRFEEEPTPAPGYLRAELPADIKAVWTNPIFSDEPIPLPGFPPLPLALSLPIYGAGGSTGSFQHYQKYVPGNITSAITESGGKNTGQSQTQQTGTVSPAQDAFASNKDQWDRPTLQGQTNGTIPDPSKYFKAEKLFRESKFEEAIEAGEESYFQSAKSDSTQLASARLVALAFKKLGERELSQMWAQMQPPRPDASANFTYATTSAKRSERIDTPLTHNKHAKQFESQKHWKNAFEEYELALKGDPHRQQFQIDLARAHMNYGKYLQQRKNGDEAIAEFRRALYVYPSLDEADDALDKALKASGKDPLDIKFRIESGNKADLENDNVVAVAEFAKAVKLNPKDVDAHLLYGKALIKSGRVHAGYKEQSIAAGLDWSSRDKIQLGTVHRELGVILLEHALLAKDAGKGTIGMMILSIAYGELRRAVQLNPKDTVALEALKNCTLHAVQIRPLDFDNRLALAGTYLLAGDFDRARMSYNDCWNFGKNRPELISARLAYHQAIARSPLSTDAQIADSVEKVKGFIDQEPDNARLWYILGRLREHQNDPEKAKKCYEKSASINPHVDDLKAALARVEVTSSNK